MNLFSLINSLDAVHPYVSGEEEKAYKAYQANIARWVANCLVRRESCDNDSADFEEVSAFLRRSPRATEDIEKVSKVDLNRASFQHQVFGGRFEKEGFNTYYVSCDIRNFAYQNFVAIMNNFRSIQGETTNSMALLAWSTLLRQAFFAPNQDIRDRIAAMKAFFDEKGWAYCMDRDGGDEIVFAIQVLDSVPLNEDEFKGLAKTLDLRMVVAELSSRLVGKFNAKDFLDLLEAADKRIKEALQKNPEESPLEFILN